MREIGLAELLELGGKPSETVSVEKLREYLLRGYVKYVTKLCSVLNYDHIQNIGEQLPTLNVSRRGYIVNLYKGLEPPAEITSKFNWMGININPGRVYTLVYNLWRTGMENFYIELPTAPIYMAQAVIGTKSDDIVAREQIREICNAQAEYALPAIESWSEGLIIPDMVAAERKLSIALEGILKN